ncbi:MAG: serpin family protein [Acidobacteriota bacterium]
MRRQLEEMNMREMFRDLVCMIRIPRSRLTDMAQIVDIRVTEAGILANAETLVGIVYGGMMTGEERFHLKLDRPFLFTIRDRLTGALMIIGAVMDPTQDAAQEDQSINPPSQP